MHKRNCIPLAIIVKNFNNGFFLNFDTSWLRTLALDGVGNPFDLKDILSSEIKTLVYIDVLSS